jgi:hypothetical protein
MPVCWHAPRKEKGDADTLGSRLLARARVDGDRGDGGHLGHVAASTHASDAGAVPVRGVRRPWVRETPLAPRRGIRDRPRSLSEENVRAPRGQRLRVPHDDRATHRKRAHHRDLVRATRWPRLHALGRRRPRRLGPKSKEDTARPASHRNASHDREGAHRSRGNQRGRSRPSASRPQVPGMARGKASFGLGSDRVAGRDRDEPGQRIGQYTSVRRCFSGILASSSR